MTIVMAIHKWWLMVSEAEREVKVHYRMRRRAIPLRKYNMFYEVIQILRLTVSVECVDVCTCRTCRCLCKQSVEKEECV